MTLVFDSINTKAGTARLIGNAGAADVTVLETPNHLNFVEVAPAGNIKLTSIYVTARDLKAGHFRHVGRIEKPMLSQHYGSCQVHDD